MISTKTIRLIEENIGVNLCDLGLIRQQILGVKPKTQATKETVDKLGFTKMYNFCVNKGYNVKKKKAHIMGRKNCKSYIWNILRTLTNQQKITQFLKGQRI